MSVSLDGPSRKILVEPITAPAPPEPQRPETEPSPEPREPVPEGEPATRP